MKYDPWFDSDENKVLMAVSTRRMIKNLGIGGIVWGAINIVLGVGAMQETLINVGLLILGILMLGAGVQALLKPSLGILLAETIVTALLFLWNLAVTVLNTLAGAEFDPAGLVIPLLVAVSLVQSYKKLNHIRDLIPTVSSQDIRATKRAWDSIKKKKLKQEPLVVKASGSNCRVQLMPDQAFFVHWDFFMRAFVVPRDAMVAALARSDVKKLTFNFKHPLNKIRYTFNRKNYDKLKAWLAASGN